MTSALWRQAQRGRFYGEPRTSGLQRNQKLRMLNRAKANTTAIKDNDIAMVGPLAEQVLPSVQPF
jgi:hypothetical protein